MVEWNQMTYLSIAAAVVGAILLMLGSKQRNEQGEWGSAVQWGYLLLMAGVFGFLSVGLTWSFTAVLLVFTLLTGVVWVWAKSVKKDKNVLDNNHFRDYMAGFFPIIGVVFLVRTFIAEPFQIPSSSMRPNLVKGDFILVNKFAYGIRIPVLNSVLIPTGKIERGDVVVFNFPMDTKVNYIKRIVAVGGDVIEYKDKILTVNGVVEQDTETGTYRYPDDNQGSLMRESQNYQAQFGERRFEVLKDTGAPSVEPATFNYYQSQLNQRDMPNLIQENCEYASDGSAFKCRVPEGQYFAMGDNRDNSADSRYWGFVDDNLTVGKAFFIWLNVGDMKRMGTKIQ